MIRAKLENGVEVIFKNGKWNCADSYLAERLNNCQDYWKSKDEESYFDSHSQDYVAAAKVLAQFDGEVSYIKPERYVTTSNDSRVF